MGFLSPSPPFLCFFFIFWSFIFKVKKLNLKLTVIETFFRLFLFIYFLPSYKIFEKRVQAFNAFIENDILHNTKKYSEYILYAKSSI